MHSRFSSKHATLFLIAVLAASPLIAGPESLGTTSATFTKLGSGARAQALGEAYVGLSDDATGLAYNPAGMAQMLSGEIQFTHSEWFQSLRFENINAVTSLGDGGMLGLTFNTLVIPQLTRTEQIANTDDPALNYKETGSFQPYDMQFAASYARPVYPNLQAGVTMKVLGQYLDSLSAYGIGLDLGAMYKTPVKGLRTGFTAQNVGTPIRFRKEGFNLPTVFRLGACYELMDSKLLLLPEVDMPLDNYPVGAFGMEYNLADTFYPRVGYRYNNVFNPWSLGMGVKFQLWGFDFAMVPYGELGMTYRGSLSYKFGTPGANLLSPNPYLSSIKSGSYSVLRQEVSAPDKVLAWGLYIYSSGAKPAIVRTFSGKGAVPKEQMWDGKDDKGNPVPEGVYNAVLSLRYATGDTAHSSYLRLEVDNHAPVADLQVAADSFRSDDKTLLVVPAKFVPKTQEGRTPASWRLEVIGPDDKVFRVIQGQDALPESIVWDGKGDMNQAFYSGYIYSFRFSITDKVGNQSTSGTPLSYRCVFRQ
jgi:hypothetical protein